MRRYDFAKALYSMFDEGAEEVLVEIDGKLHDFEMKFVEEQFDGFDTAYPPCVTLVPEQGGECDLNNDDEW